MKRIASLCIIAMRRIGIVEAALSAVFLAAILVLVVLQIFLRYVPVGANSVWVGELARYSLVWLTFVAIGTLITRNEHPVIETIDSIAKGMVRRVVIVFANVTIAVISASFAWDSAGLVFTDVATKTPVIGIPMQVAMFIPFAGFVLATVHALVRAFAVAVGVQRGDETTTADIA